jgi:hypothetical protein
VTIFLPETTLRGQVARWEWCNPWRFPFALTGCKIQDERSWRNWQTHQLEGLTVAIPWWFESTRPHQFHSRRFSFTLAKTQSDRRFPERESPADWDEVYLTSAAESLESLPLDVKKIGIKV